MGAAPLPLVPEELVVLVERSGLPTGVAPRREVHGRPDLLHATVHVMVRTSAGEFLLQKRSWSKDVGPGLWDTSVGGHLLPGESAEEGARRELGEELGVTAPVALVPRGTYIFRDGVESEFVTSFACVLDGPFTPCPEEIQELRLFTREEISALMGSGGCTPHLEREINVAWGPHR